MSALKNLSTITGVVFAVYALSLASALNELELSPQSDLESMEDIQELLRNVQLIFETKIASKVREGILPEDEDENNGAVDPNGCNCSGLKCSCCQYIRAPKLNLNGNACITVTYLPRNYGILVSFTFGGRQIFAKEISARNPPPICAGIPYFKRGGSICIQFYNLNVGKKTFSGCTRFLGRLLYITIVKINTGCFHINYLNETQQIGAMGEIPYFDEPQTLMEGPEPVYIGEIQAERIKPAGYKKN